MDKEQELPDGWEWTTLGEICSKPQYGWTTKADAKQGAIKLLRTTDITSSSINWDAVPYCTEIPDNLDAYKLVEGDIVISRAGSVGFSYLLALVPSTTVFASYLIRFRPDQEIEARYIAYYLQTSTYWDFIQEQSSGIALANVNARKLEMLEIPLAPLPEQHRIVSVLEEQFTRLDAAIASLQQDKARLKQARASVLKAAVDGTLTEAWRATHPNVEPTEELLERILLERREKWEADLRAKGRDSEKTKYLEPVQPNLDNLPELPEGWFWTSIGQCFEVHIGSTPRRNEPAYWNGDIPWASSSEIQFCRIKDTKEYITQAGLENSSVQLNPVGSVLLGMIGEGRTRGQVAILDIKACNSQNSAAIWVPQTTVVPEFIYYWLWSQYEITRRGGSGNSQPALNKYRVEQIKFPLPPLSEQQQIVAEVEARLSVIAQAETVVETSLKRAERTRQSILQKAFSGQLVPQDPNDEPASVLLERIRAEREKRELEEQQRKKEERMNRPRITRKTNSGKEQKPLVEVLREEPRPLSPVDLFKKAGLDQDDVEDVERFHVELLDEVSVHKSVRLVPSGLEEPKDLLEAVDQ